MKISVDIPDELLAELQAARDRWCELVADTAAMSARDWDTLATVEGRLVDLCRQLAKTAGTESPFWDLAMDAANGWTEQAHRSRGHHVALTEQEQRQAARAAAEEPRYCEHDEFADTCQLPHNLTIPQPKESNARVH